MTITPRSHAPDTAAPATVDHWEYRAACGGADPRIFDTDVIAETRNSGDRDGKIKAARMLREALTICQSCDVADECLRQAMDAEGSARTGQRWGISGGTTPADRYAAYKLHIAMLKRNRKAPRPRPRTVPAECGTPGGYRRHRRLREEACPGCLQAKREESSTSYHARRARAASERAA